jgi:parvulin-like peptidyl-prolyl isomerase
MTFVPFLVVDDRSISLNQAVTYLQDSGKFPDFLWEILSRYAIEKELQESLNIEISPAELDQQIMDFRLRYELTASEDFQEWLESEKKTYEDFRRQMQYELQLQSLQKIVTAPKIQEYFVENKIFLDRLVLSQIVVESKEQAEELKSQISDDGIRFEQIAQEYSIAAESILNGLVGEISRGSMPNELRAVVDTSQVGELLGPVEFDGLFYLLRIEKILPAILDKALEHSLGEDIFQQWLNAKVQNMQVQIEIALDDRL